MDRRDFLWSVAAASSIAGVQPGQTPRSSANQRGLKLGTVTYNIAKDWDLPTLIKNLSDTGFDGGRAENDTQAWRRDLAPASTRAEVRKRFEDSPVKIGGLGTTCEYQSADPGVLRKNIDETREWVRLARDIGSPSVKVRPNGLVKDVPEERTLEQIGKALRECGGVAADHGVMIQLEVHGETTSRLPRIRKILDYADNHPGVRVCWNSNQTDLLDGGFEANFQLVRAQIGQVHMRDLFLEEYPWRQLLTALTDLRFDGYCFAEIPESADPLRVLKYFRGLFRAYQGL